MKAALLSSHCGSSLGLLWCALVACSGYAAPGDLKWHLPVSIAAGPVLGTNGLVYGVTAPGRLYAWDAATGQTRWETNVGGAFNYGIIVVGPDSHLYLHASSGLHALDGETGRELWHVDDYFESLAVGADGTVLASNYEGMLALDPSNGRRRWSYFGQLYGIPALSANGLIFTLASLGRVLAIDAATGKRVWEFQERTAYFSSLIVAREGTVLVRGSFDLTNHREERLVALDGATGKQLWRFIAPGQINEMLVREDGSICVGSYNGIIHVLDPLTGNTQREFTLAFNTIGGLTLVADHSFYFAVHGPDDHRGIYALNFATGETSWVFSPTNSAVDGLNVGADGTLYFHNYYYSTGMFAVHGSSPLADSAWPRALQNAQNTSLWRITGLPTITRQPSSHWAAMDAKTAFHFYSPVMRPLHVQWRFNGQPIPGATNESLTIDPVRFADAGSYTVVLSNQFGTVISEEAILSVGYALDVTTLGSGIVQRVPDLEVYPSNSMVQLTAVPATDRNFLGWSGDATGSVETISLSLDRNHAITASFQYLVGDVKWMLPMDDIALSHDGTIAYGRTLYRYIAVDTRTRQIIWEVESGAENYSPPAVGPNGDVYYTSYGENLAFVDGRTGAIKGSAGIGVCTFTPASVGTDGTVYFSGSKLFAFDPVTGVVKWSVDEFGDYTGVVIGPDGVLYARGTNGIVALDGETGEKLRDYGPGTDWSLPLIASDNTLYFGSPTDWKVYAFDGNTAQMLWETNHVASIIGPDGVLYARSSTGTLLALNGRTGVQLWESEVPGVPTLTADGTLLLSSAGKLTAVDSANGAILWEYEGATYLVAGAHPNIGPDGTLYFGRYVVHGTSPLASGGWPKGKQNPQNNSAQMHTGVPSVTRPPSGHWAAENGTTTFRFYSPTRRPLHVQWQFNGQNIPGATNEVLTIEGVQFQHAGNYSVVLSNQLGVTTSTAAVLSVGHELAVTVDGLGTVQRTPDLAVYPTNSVVQLIATPQSPRNFLGWTGDATTQSNTIEITLTRNHRLTANFEFLPGDRKWEFATRAYWLDSTPAIGVDGTLYFTGGGTLYAVDSVTRQKKWEFQPAEGSPALGANGTLYVGSGVSKVFALDAATGGLKWESIVDIHERIGSSPALGIDGTVYITGQRLYALDGRTGQLKWTFPAGSTPPAIGADGTVYCASHSGNVYALDGVTGATKWEFAATNMVTGSIALGRDGTICIAAWYGKVFALNAMTGEVKWQFDTSGYVLNSPVVGPDGAVYVGTSYGAFYALNGDTGVLKWSFQVSGDANTPVIGADGTLYLISGGGSLYAMTASTGEPKWELPLTEWGNRGAPTLAPDGTLYVGSVGDNHTYTGGPLVAVQASSGLASGSWPKFRGQLDNRARLHSRPRLDALELSPAGAEFTVYSEQNERLTIQASDDLINWNPLQIVTNTTGTLRVADESPTVRQRTYRARVP